MLFKDCGWTDDEDADADDDSDDGRWVITIPHLEPSAKVSQKEKTMFLKIEFSN